MLLLKKYYESIIHDKQSKIDANNEYPIFISQTQRKQKSRREKTTHVWSKWGTLPGKSLFLVERYFTAKLKRYSDINFDFFIQTNSLIY